MTHALETFTSYYLSPLGGLRISVTATAVQEVTFCAEQEMAAQATIAAAPDLLQVCINQLDNYFCGKSKHFELPLEQPGTDFQQRVWNELLTIPYGATISYLELSRRLGNEKSN